jgi:hypothetical protein
LDIEFLLQYGDQRDGGQGVPGRDGFDVGVGNLIGWKGRKYRRETAGKTVIQFTSYNAVRDYLQRQIK